MRSRATSTLTTRVAGQYAVRRVVRAVQALDAAAFRGTARKHSPILDAALPLLSRAADHSVLWLVLAAALDLSGDRRAGRAARRGVLCLAATSATVNAVAKRALPRRRPALTGVPLARRPARVPTSSSFPSGHAASAAAFAVAVGLELPLAAAPLGALAAAVGYSRVYTGVHYPSDVLAGAAMGAGLALAAARLVPLHTPSGVRRLPSQQVPQPPRPGGAEVVGVINPRSGSGRGARVLQTVTAELPDARFTVLRDGADLEQALREVAAHGEVLAVAGGDGSVNAGAKVALEMGLPLLVLPAGTFNHFARDLGITRTADAAAAVRAGTAVRVDVGSVGGRLFLNTASLGSYPDFVAARERRESRLGKPLAGALALWGVARTNQPLRAVVDGQERSLAMLFIGNGRYQPRGFAPSWRPRLDDGKLDVRLVEAGTRAGALRLVTSLLLGRLGRSRLYSEDDPVDLKVRLPDGPADLACDGELGLAPADLVFDKKRRALTVYRHQGWRVPGPRAGDRC